MTVNEAKRIIQRVQERAMVSLAYRLRRECGWLGRQPGEYICPDPLDHGSVVMSSIPGLIEQIRQERDQLRAENAELRKRLAEIKSALVAWAGCPHAEMVKTPELRAIWWLSRRIAEESR